MNVEVISQMIVKRNSTIIRIMETWTNFITDVAQKEGMIHFVWDALYAVLKNLLEFQKMIFTRVRLVSDFSIALKSFFNNKYSYLMPMKRYLEVVQRAKLSLAITMRRNVMEPIFVSVIMNYAMMFAMISLPLQQIQLMIRQKEQILQMH